MKKLLLPLVVSISLFLNAPGLYAQENYELAIAPFQFTASTPKEVTENIKEVITYSKSISSQFNQSVKGNLILTLDGNTSITQIETKFDGHIDMEGADYSTISDFLGIDFRKKQNYYFIPQHDAPTWFESKESGLVWVDMNVIKGKGGNNMIFRFYFPAKNAGGKPYESEYPISSITLNDKAVPLAAGKKSYGALKVATMFTDTIRSESNTMKVEIKIKGMGKFKLMYLDKNQGQDFSKIPIKGFQFYNLPAKAVYDDSLFFSMARVGAYSINPNEKYQACIVLTLSNGKECPLKKKDKFIVRPIIQEFKTGKIDSLEKRTISNKSGSLIYKYLFDIPKGTSEVQFNYKAILECKNNIDDDKFQGHTNSCSVFIFKSEE